MTECRTIIHFKLLNEQSDLNIIWQTMFIFCTFIGTLANISKDNHKLIWSLCIYKSILCIYKSKRTMKDNNLILWRKTCSDLYWNFVLFISDFLMYILRRNHKCLHHTIATLGPILESQLSWKSLTRLSLQDRATKWHYFPNSNPPTHPPTHPSHRISLWHPFLSNYWFDLTQNLN